MQAVKINNKKNKIPNTNRNDNSYKENFHIFFQRTYDNGFKIAIKK